MHKLYIVIINETVAPSELQLLFSSHGLWLLNELAVAEVPAWLVPELSDGVFSEVSSAFEFEFYLREAKYLGIDTFHL